MENLTPVPSLEDILRIYSTKLSGRNSQTQTFFVLHLN